MVKFRFENLNVWKNSICITDQIFNISDSLERKHLYRWAEQLRSSGLSISNNIAEGSGSHSKKEFRHFLNISRRSVFETANILIILLRRQLISQNLFKPLLEQLEYLSRQITSFQRSLLTKM